MRVPGMKRTGFALKLSPRSLSVSLNIKDAATEKTVRELAYEH